MTIESKAVQTTTVSPETRTLMREAAIERGRQRSTQVSERVRATMRMIEEEIASNLGVYPHNKNTLSAAEVARRAGIHPTTFHSPNQQKLCADVKLWIAKIKLGAERKEQPARRDLNQRIASWKQLYNGLAQSHRDTELDLQAAQGELLQLRYDFDVLERENIRLHEMLKSSSNPNILQLPRRTRDESDAAGLASRSEP